MLDFTNNNIDTLPKYQEATFLPIDNKYWNVMVINTFISSIFIFGFMAVLFFSIFFRAEVYNGIEIYLSIIILAILFILILFFINRISFKKRAYAVREKDIMYRRGILSTTITIVPFNRIQHIAVNEGMFSRMYDLASLEIYTAGGNSSNLSIVGIERKKAYQIKEFLMNNINAEPTSKTTDIESED